MTQRSWGSQHQCVQLASRESYVRLISAKLWLLVPGEWCCDVGEAHPQRNVMLVMHSLLTPSLQAHIILYVFITCNLHHSSHYLKKKGHDLHMCSKLSVTCFAVLSGNSSKKKKKRSKHHIPPICSSCQHLDPHCSLLVRREETVHVTRMKGTH